MIHTEPRCTDLGEQQEPTRHRDVLQEHDLLGLITEIRVKNRC